MTQYLIKTIIQSCLTLSKSHLNEFNIPMPKINYIITKIHSKFRLKNLFSSKKFKASNDRFIFQIFFL